MGTIKKETEGLILAAQEQALQTNAMKAKMQKSTDIPNCRLCNDKVETVSRLICECSKIAQIDYKARHDRVPKLIHWSLCKKYDLPVSEKSWEHKEEKVVENETVKILWDFQIQMDHHLEHSTPDITVVENQSVQFIDIAVPGDASDEEKELEKNHEISRSGHRNYAIMDETCNSDTHCHRGTWYHVQEFCKIHQEVAASCCSASGAAKDCATQNNIHFKKILG